MKGIELFEKIKQVSTFDELFNEPTQSKLGNLFEKLWCLVIMFGFIPCFRKDEYDHYEGNINTCKLTKIDNLSTLSVS